MSHDMENEAGISPANVDIAAQIAQERREKIAALNDLARTARTRPRPPLTFQGPRFCSRLKFGISSGI